MPGTVASTLRAAAEWTFDDSPDFDAEDWWFRCRVKLDPCPPGGRTVLRFGGLASLADVWIDGAHVVRSESMFVEHAVDLENVANGECEIAIRFSSLNEALKKRRPRPRWRATVVTQQQLRWFRTTLLGRVPWTPPVSAVGPCGAVCIETQTRLRVLSADVKARLEGRDGVCDVDLRLVSLGPSIRGGSITIGDERFDLTCERTPEDVVLRGAPRLREASPWWPFTHGDPALYAVRAQVATDVGEIEVDLGRTGFRSIEIDRGGGGFGVRVNGVDVFCRGACWTPLDMISLQTDPAAQRAALEAVKSAGMNMLRLSGAMVYAPTTFHDACDELGILVWQDLMFANMDYPFADETFAGMARAEVAHVVDRLQMSPSFAVLCGNSEIEQQSAMLGLPPEAWSSQFFESIVPAIASAARPGIAYVPSSPTGGALPFRVDVGVSHYYGVGGYRRPLEDARRARVRFTSECLGFANVPCDETIDELMGGEVPTNHPRWKRRVPRDNGTAWDFDDVRDHYVRELFDVDPAALRMLDVRRYLELGRVATGEAMAATMAEWRRARSECRGAIVWLLRDFWPGAGWGVIDSHGRPKAAYYFLKRALQPTTILATDEGLNGLSLHVLNDGPGPLEAQVRLVLYRFGDVPVAEGTATISVPAHGATELLGDSLLGRFTDTTYAYRFAAPGHDLAVATLVRRDSGECVAQAFFFPGGCPAQRHADLGVEATAERVQAGQWRVRVRTRKFAHAIAFDAPGFIADDDLFHLEPGGERSVVLRGPDTFASVRLMPLNATTPTRIVLLT